MALVFQFTHSEESNSLERNFEFLACLPFTIIRAAMINLDCFIIRRRQLGDDFEERVLLESSKNRTKVNNLTLYHNHSFSEIIASNSESNELKFRLYLSLICSGLGNFVMTFCLIGISVFIALQMF